MFNKIKLRTHIPTEDIYFSANILNLSSIYKFEIAKPIYNIRHGILPSHFVERLQPIPQHPHTYPTRRKPSFTPPISNAMSALSNGASLWNRLELNIKKMDKMEYCRHIKKELVEGRTF